MGGQGEARQLVISKWRVLKTAALGALAACGVFAAANAAEKAGERQTPSGMPVPRYVSLKFDKVNARSGPGDDHKLLFVYRVRGLPLQVIAETSEWRRVCDPEGTRAWVHKRVTDGRRTTMNTSTQPVALLKRPKDGFRPAAYLNPRALATLDRCDRGWCKVRADHASGWVREGELWGTTDGPQCHQGGS
jgi:SH3-like domain-containing protein